MQKRRTRAKAIRAKCLDCCCNQQAEVKACIVKTYPLWIYRMGYEVDFDGKRLKRDSREDSECPLFAEKTAVAQNFKG